MLKLSLVYKKHKNKISKIEQESEDTRPDGMKELFYELLDTCSTYSYNNSRIYYLAYLLSKENIEFTISEVE